MKMHTAVTVSLTVFLTAAFGLAQLNLSKIYAKIPHEFTVAGKVLPAGQYSFTCDYEKKLVTVKDADGGPSVFAPIVTLLAGGMHTTASDSHVVFDKVGSNYYLSELWMPGVDGILLLTTKEKHEHEMINIPR